MSVSWGFRFSPHVLVIMATLLVAIPPLRGSIVAFVHLWWDSTYKQVEFVMDEARPNDGSPYIAGHQGSTDQHNLIGQMNGAGMVVKALPQEAFAEGKRLLIWHSEEAPTFVAFGQEVNNLPVASLLERPGLLSLLIHLVWLFATGFVGLMAAAWVAARFSRTYGDLPMKRRRL